jgi:serine/threonine-protein kinase
MKRLCTVLACALCLQFPVHTAAQTSPGTITTIAGTGTVGFSGDGGPATSAQFNGLTDVAVDAKGNIYIADFTNGRVRKIAPDGTITTFAGGATGVPVGTGNGLPATQAMLIGPSRVTVDKDGNVYISDSGSQRVARVGTDGVFRTVAGGTTILGGFSGDGGRPRRPG